MQLFLVMSSTFSSTVANTEAKAEAATKALAKFEFAMIPGGGEMVNSVVKLTSMTQDTVVSLSMRSF